MNTIWKDYIDRFFFQAEVMKLSEIVHVEVSLNLTDNFGQSDGVNIAEKMRTSDSAIKFA